VGSDLFEQKYLARPDPSDPVQIDSYAQGWKRGCG
jgi:hypothetical protein